MSIHNGPYPVQKSRWLYTGPGMGSGTVHTVVSSPKVEGGVEWDEVMTWSDWIGPIEDGDGFSWLGSLADFCRYFRPLLN